MKALNDALYQISVMARLSNTAGTSAGRFFYAYNILPELLAANRFTEVSKVIPQVDDINGGRSVYIDLFRAVFYGAATYEEGVFPDLDNDEQFLLALLKDQPQEASGIWLKSVSRINGPVSLAKPDLPEVFLCVGMLTTTSVSRSLMGLLED